MDWDEIHELANQAKDRCDTMKPRFEEMSYETTVMLEKAKAMNNRLDRIEKEMTHHCQQVHLEHQKEVNGKYENTS